MSLTYDLKMGDTLKIRVMRIQCMLFALVLQDSLNVFNMHWGNVLSNKFKASKIHLHLLFYVQNFIQVKLWLSKCSAKLKIDWGITLYCLKFNIVIQVRKIAFRC